MYMGNKPSSHVHSKFQGRVEYQEPKTEFPGVWRRGSRQKTLVVGILITSRNNTVWCLLININVRVSLTLTFINYFSSDIARRNIPILFFANKSDCKEALTAVQVGYKLRNTSNRHFFSLRCTCRELQSFVRSQVARHLGPGWPGLDLMNTTIIINNYLPACLVKGKGFYI